VHNKSKIYHPVKTGFSAYWNSAIVIVQELKNIYHGKRGAINQEINLIIALSNCLKQNID
jgi:hypothetical protein